MIRDAVFCSSARLQPSYSPAPTGTPPTWTSFESSAIPCSAARRERGGVGVGVSVLGLVRWGCGANAYRAGVAVGVCRIE